MTTQQQRSSVQLGRDLRLRRRSLGLSQSRLGAQIGARATKIARWERGESIPTPSEVAALSQALKLDPADERAWLDLSERVSGIPVRLVGPPVSGEGADPFSNGDAPKKKGSGKRRRNRVVPIRPASDDPAVPGASKKALRSDRAALLEETPHIRSTVVSGSVFPMPAGLGHTRAELNPRPAPPSDQAAEQARYLTRWALTFVALAVLGGLLFWAVGEFWTGWGSAVDSFRSDDPTRPIVDGLNSITGR